MSKRIILGVQIDHRVEKVPNVQAVFTEFGCHIRTRLGLHEVTDGACAPGGLVLLDTFGDPDEIAEMEAKLAGMPGVEVHKMEFEV